MLNKGVAIRDKESLTGKLYYFFIVFKKNYLIYKIIFTPMIA